ncbi:hypothetical protein [Prevotella sp. 10(H)]|uniref:LIC_10190 family membrane protein n=1 Tax=Prevotella sp. 10(H) TaxID=1158294 RepID=UPI0012DE3656|nr:hypothetical protein [Prevotella sp. 10(H)]
MVLFSSNLFDGPYYHYQHIKWNEEYRITPGLANLEDRLGFNSNYLLISALFSFRFLFGEAVYTLQSLFFILILWWAFIQLFRNVEKIKSLILLIFLFIIILTCRSMLCDTSTDIIPILFVFYFVVKTSQNPDWWKNKFLLACLLPVTLVTFKLSAAVFSMIAIAILIVLLRQKNYKKLSFLMTAAVLIVGLWCVRNVIISGYLVYPVYSIDLFSFDWKLPRTTIFFQQTHIHNWAIQIYKGEYIHRIFDVWLNGNKLILLTNTVSFTLMVFGIFLSPLYLLYTKIRKIKINPSLVFLFVVLICCTVFGLISAPDLRFMNGYIFSSSFLMTILMVPQKVIDYPKLNYLIIFLLIICSGFLLIRDIQKAHIRGFEYTDRSILSLGMHPWQPQYKGVYDEYIMNGHIIYITNDRHHRIYNKMPAAAKGGLPFAPFQGNKIQSIKTVELRGKHLEDGFRTKKEYIDILNENVDKYKADYDTIVWMRY